MVFSIEDREEVIQWAKDYFEFEKLRGWHPVRCVNPDHKDKNPSAGVSLEVYYYNCLGCGFKMNLKSLKDYLEGEEISLESDIYEQELKYENPAYKNLDIKIRDLDAEFSAFSVERRLEQNVLNKLGVRVDKEIGSDTCGYLKYSYGKDKYVARNLLNEGIRYKNSNGSKGLLGEDVVDKFDSILLVEGLTDWLTARSMGIENSVAVLGANVSGNEIFPLRNKTVYILFDLDWAGFQGTKKVSQLLKDIGSLPIILNLDDYKRVAGKDISDKWVVYGDEFKYWLIEQISQETKERKLEDVFGKTSKQTRTYKTSLPSLDRCFGGFGFGNGIHLITGQPGTGKTALAVHFADEFRKQGASILYVSYELSIRQVYARFAARYSQLNWIQIEVSPESLEVAVKERLEEIIKQINVVHDYDVNRIIAEAKHYDVVVIDYLQLMPGDDKRKDEYSIVSENINKLTEISRDSDKLILGLSSMPREAYGKTNSMAIFKSSGSAEYAATSALLLNVDHDGNKTLKIVKNRRGLAGENIGIDINYPHSKLIERNFSYGWAQEQGTN